MLATGSLRAPIPSQSCGQAGAIGHRSYLLLSLLQEQLLKHRVSRIGVALLVRLIDLHKALAELLRAFVKAVGAALVVHTVSVVFLIHLLLVQLGGALSGYLLGTRTAAQDKQDKEITHTASIGEVEPQVYAA